MSLSERKKVREIDFDIDGFLNVQEPYYKCGEYDFIKIKSTLFHLSFQKRNMNQCGYSVIMFLKHKALILYQNLKSIVTNA